jgi:tetratricopeptide (TPR) repeat protein
MFKSSKPKPATFEVDCDDPKALTKFLTQYNLTIRTANEWIHLGARFLEKKVDCLALKSFEKAIEVEPDNAGAWFQLITCHLLMNEVENAAKVITLALDTYQYNKPFLRELEQKFLQLRDNTISETPLKKIRELIGEDD